MKEKVVFKPSVFSIVFVLAFALFLFTTQVIYSDETLIYELGDTMHLPLSNYEDTLLRVSTPSKIYDVSPGSSRFSLYLEEVGTYSIAVKTPSSYDQIFFEVSDDSVVSQEPSSVTRVFDELRALNGNVIRSENDPISDNSQDFLDSSLIRVGEPVKHSEKISLSSQSTVKLKVHSSTSNVSFGKDNNFEYSVDENLFDSLNNFFTQDDRSSLIIRDAEGTFNVTYYTAAPKKSERDLEKSHKEVVVSSEEGLHYENVLVETNVDEVISVDNPELIQIYWTEEGRFLQARVHDSNNDGFIDSVSWIVPHLSTQTFQVIVITKAQHLDSNRSFISDIYANVSELDGVWQYIPSGDYVRVTFEENLTSENDITLYAKSYSNDSVLVEVYEENSSVKIAEFEPIASEAYYKIYLGDLVSESQDTFDLKISGDILIDLIIDPTAIGSCVGILACVDNGGVGSCTCAQVTSSNNVYLSAGLSSKSGNLGQGVINLTNASLFPSNAVVTDAELSIEYYAESGFSTCTIEYGTLAGIPGGSQTTLDSDCSDETTESVKTYDLSSLSANQLKNISVNFTVIKQANQGAPLDFFVDYIYLNITYTLPGELAVYLNDPANLFNFNTPNYIFNYTPVTSNGNFLNCSFYDNSSGAWSFRSLNTSVIVNGTENSFIENYSVDSSYLWGVECCDDSNGCAFSLTNRTVIYDSTPPVVSNVAPANDSTSTSLYGVDFFYNVTDERFIDYCSLYIDGAAVTTDDSITRNINQTISYPVPDGIHLWNIGCADLAGNLNFSQNYTINVSFTPQTYDARWYETSSGSTNYTSTADILLANTRDSQENFVNFDVPSSSLYTLVDSVSPFMSNNGALIGAGTVSFSGYFEVSQNNQEYITWKVYVTNTSGDTLLCEAGDDSTGGTRISSATGTFTDTCTLSGDYYLDSLDRIKMEVNIWNSFGSAVTVDHYWDNLFLSYVEFNRFDSLGDLFVSLTSPLTPQSITTAEQLNVSCNVSCSAGECKNTNVYVEYNTSAVEWTTISGSGNLVLASGETNPHFLGNVTSAGNVTNFTIEGNINSVNNIRCIATSDYSDFNGTTSTQVTVTAANQNPFVLLLSPDDGFWSNSQDVTFFYNASDDGVLDTCQIYLDGVLNQTDSSPSEILTNNFTITGISQGAHNWSIWCNDTTGLENQTLNRTLNVDIVDPSLLLVSPFDGQTVTSSNVDFLFNVSDNLDSSITCSLNVDGTLRNSPFEVVNGTQENRTVTGLFVGIHYWNVTCTDEATNQNISQTWNFTVTDTPPEVNLSYPFNASWVNTSTVTFLYNASDNNNLLSCELYLDGSLNQTNQTVLNNGGENNFTVSGVNQGNHNWSVNCTDDNSLSTLSSIFLFTVDTEVPFIYLNAPANDSSFSFSSLNFNYTVVDNLDSTLTCNLTYAGVLEVTNSADANNTLINHLLSNLPDGQNNWSVTCIDEAGNTNSSVFWLVNISDVPNVDLLTANNFSFNTTTVNLSYLPSDNMDLTSCDLYIDGVFNKSNESVVVNGASNIFSFNESEGRYNWSVLCTDTFGYTNQSETRNFSIDLTAPNIDLFYPLSGQTVYDSVVLFNLTATDSVDPLIFCNLTVDGSVVNSSTFVNGSVGSYEQVFSSGGLKLWNVTCIDDAGNINISETRNFTLFVPPNVTLVSPQNISWINSDPINFYYNVSDGNDDLKNSSLVLDGVLNQTNQTALVNDGENNFTVSGISEGLHNWTSYVYDYEDLLGAPTPNQFYVDRTSPLLTLNGPVQDEVVTENNVTFDFTLNDALSSNFTCNLTVDGFNEFEDDLAFNGTNLRYILRNDGNYTYSVSCYDLAGNLNSSVDVNFSVVAPPLVIYNFPLNDSALTASNLQFNYTPIDAVGIVQCDFYFDGVYNTTDTNVEANQPNFFSYENIAEGTHFWNVTCLDPDGNYNVQNTSYFTRDVSPPNLTLIAPLNATGVDFNLNSLQFRWNATDVTSSLMTCNLTIDGSIAVQNTLVTNAVTKTETLNLQNAGGEGVHYWNVTCSDELGNVNTSDTWMYNITYPDFNVTFFSINDSSPREGDAVLLNVTVSNEEYANTSNVVISFYDNDPEDTGVLIDSSTVNIDSFGSVNVSAIWLAGIGSYNLFVVVDAPRAINGSFNETVETNNFENETITVGSWQVFYGFVATDSRRLLADNSSDVLSNWSFENFNSGNLYATDIESSVSWTSLAAIGKDLTFVNSSNDFAEIDTALSMTSLNDSVYNEYTFSGVPRALDSYTVFSGVISDVPIINSTNNTNFRTGILWDGSDDIGNGEFDGSDLEDLVFVTKINKDALGAYGVYDYEFRLPARLREFDATNTQNVAFYIELE